MKKLIGCLILTASVVQAGILGEAKHIESCGSNAMAVCKEGNMLYVAADTELLAYDISSPLKPVLLGRIAGMDNRRQVFAKDGFVYVVSRETGMRIIDARDPKAMRIRSRYDSVEFATGIDVVGNVAFLSERINGVECVDVSDPDHPAHICIRKTGESQSSCYRDGYLYSGEWGGGGVTVFDARDMRNFKQVNYLNLHGFGDGVEIDGNHLYCSTGHDAKNTKLSREEARGRGRGMDIFSLDDPAKPKWVSRIDFPRFTPRNDDYWTVRVSGGFAFCCDSHNGFFVVDVKEPAKPKLLDRFCVPQKGRNWPSAAISSVAIGEGCVYVTSFPGGLFVLPFDGIVPPKRDRGVLPKNVSHRETYATDDEKFHVWRPNRPGQARTVCVNGNLVYAAFGDAGLHILKIKDDGAFERVGGLPESCQAYDCAIVAGKLLVAEGLNGFALYEINDGVNLREIERRPPLNECASVACWVWRVDDKRVVLSGRCSGYEFYDLENLCAKKPLHTAWGTCSWDKYPTDRAIGGMFPILIPYQGIRWIDVSGEKVFQVEFQKGDEDSVGSQCHGVCAFDDDKFLYTLPGGYMLVGKDRKLGEVHKLPPVPGLSKGKGYFGGIPRSDGRYVALTGRSTRKIAVFDFADPLNPKLSRAYSVSGNPDLASFYKGRIVVPCGHQGVIIEKR